ncbi:Ig-like domain-containing protein [candidate division KSB1 bacterium]|nr:Ig-like domain-containing protein [candidate division KSB1 bacterium]
MRLTIIVLAVIIFPAGNLSAQVTGLAGWNIYLDPGHSQKENMGVYGYSEAEKVLRVGLALRDNLLQTTDIDTVYISRTNDQQSVSLTQRTDHANSAGAAWYHSIHSDAGSSTANSTLLLWGQYRDGREKIPNGGREMSAYIVNLLTRGMRTTTRGSIGDCSFYGCTFTGPYLHVNRESTMPSELSEAGFHTNPAQNQRNMNAEWKTLEGKALFWSILQFHGLERPSEGICAGIVSDLETGIPLNGAHITLNGQTYVTDSYTSLFYKYTSDPNLLHNGFYYFENVPKGTHQMIVEADNYKSDTLQVVVTDTFFTFADPKTVSQVPPYVVSTSPAPGDDRFPAWDDLIIDFSRRMNRVSVETALTLTPEVTKTFIWSNNDTRLRIRKDSLKTETDYTLTIAGSAQGQYEHLLDGNGDGLGGDDFVLHFKTGPPDLRAPLLISVYPPDGSTNVELHPILNMRFDEALDPASITAGIFNLERFRDIPTVDGTLKHYTVGSQSALCFFPALPLTSGRLYIARIFPGLQDVFGNKIDSQQMFRLTTGNASFETINIDNFDSNLNSNWFVPQQSGSTTGIVTEKTSRDGNTNIVNLLTQSTTSMQINYGWETNAGAWLIREYLSGGPPRQVLFNSSHILQVYVFGDGSGNRFRFAVDDNVPVESAANHEVSPWYTIDWIGWRQVSWDMTTDGTGTWIGDGRLDGTLRFDSIQLTYNPGSAAEGTVYFDDLRLQKKVSVDVDEPAATLPSAFALQQNYPNPFNPETTIRYQIPRGRLHVSLTIFDLMGKPVRTLINAEQRAGEYVAHWDGKDAEGKPVVSGVYLYKLTAGELVQTKRMMLVR